MQSVPLIMNIVKLVAVMCLTPRKHTEHSGVKCNDVCSFLSNGSGKQVCAPNFVCSGVCGAERTHTLGDWWEKFNSKSAWGLKVFRCSCCCNFSLSLELFPDHV